MNHKEFKKELQNKLERLKFESTFVNVSKLLLNLFSPIITTAIVIFSRMYLEEDLYPAPFQLLSLVVMIHSTTGKFYSGVSATIITAIGAHYFLMEPTWSFKLSGSYYIVPTIEFFIQSLIIAFITAKFFKNLIELRKTAKNLEFTKQKFKYISEENTTIFAVTSTDGTILEANKAFSILVEGGENALIGNKVYDCPPWSNTKSSQNHLMQTIKNISEYKTSSYEDILHLSEANKIYVLISVTLINTDDTNPFLIISATDITHKKLTERSDKKEETLFSNFMHSNIVGLIFTNKERHITKANRKFLKMLGYKLGEVLEQNLDLLSFIPVTYHQRKAATIKRILKYGHGGPIEIEIKHKDGSMIPVLLSGILIDSADESFIFLIVDLSEQKKLEKKKDEFISVASHEIKTPLTIIKGYLQLLNQRTGNENYKELPKYLKVLTREVDRLTDLLEVMLDISRIETNKLKLDFSEFDIINHVKKSILSVDTMLKNKTIKFESEIKEKIIQADPNRLNQVIMNLLTNAIKHSKKEGEIIVKIEANEKNIKISVQDYGNGIPKDKLAAIFEKFYQIDKARGNIEGLGLGLFISKEIIKAHHGKIGVNSEIGRGSTFYFTLPLKKSS